MYFSYLYGIIEDALVYNFLKSGQKFKFEWLDMLFLGVKSGCILSRFFLMLSTFKLIIYSWKICYLEILTAALPSVDWGTNETFAS